MRPLDKWLSWFRPLARGRFGVSHEALGDWHAWHEALGMTGGRFWLRVLGGHNLYRRNAHDVNAARAFAGRADGPAATAVTFPWVGHAANASYVYSLSVVGAGGVEDCADAPRTNVCFDSDGAWAAMAPNRVTDLSATPAAGGAFALNWRYDETGQSGKPDQFAIFCGVGSPAAVDLETTVATVPYRFRRGRFGWTSGAFAHGAIVHWQVRAVSSAGNVGALSNIATRVASATAGSVAAEAVSLGVVT